MRSRLSSDKNYKNIIFQTVKDANQSPDYVVEISEKGKFVSYESFGNLISSVVTFGAIPMDINRHYRATLLLSNKEMHQINQLEVSEDVVLSASWGTEFMQQIHINCDIGEKMFKSLMLSPGNSK